MKPSHKLYRTTVCFDGVILQDWIYLGRDIGIFYSDIQRLLKTKDEDLMLMARNGAWLQSGNHVFFWDKPKKALIHNWKMTGRIMTGTWESKYLKRKK